jgi:NAD(P)-dependent dehydrogenase (short-subunit alcohol dehydrogenase family)
MTASLDAQQPLGGDGAATGPIRAVVTAGDSGIGKATAVELGRRGWHVGVTWHSDREGAEGTAAEIEEAGGRAAVCRLDLTRLPDAADVIDELADELGGLDVLVNNAGQGASTPFVELGYDDWRRVMSVDLDGSFLCAQRAARRMIAAGRGGRIVNVTSIHEHLPLRGSAAYCAAKGGLGLLTKVMAVELGEHGITVNSVAPGQIATPMTGADDADAASIRRPAVPLRRAGDAREIAAVIAFLASPEASYVTGHSLVADGGLGLMGPVWNQET